VTQDEALTILKTGANVFLTGEPGSGKTHTVNRYVSWLTARGVEPAITASTGIAATHIGGYTIHSWSGIGIKRFLSDYDLDQIGQNKRIVDQVLGAKVLIIDEVSMLGASTLSMVDAVCRTIKRDERPFGGIQVLLVGDFFQLPPVNRRSDYEDESQELFEDRRSQFSFGSPAWERLSPIVCYLHEQHRQEDMEFLAVLSAMRRNALTPVHRELLRTRFTTDPGETTTKLYSHNEDVDRINDERIAQLESGARIFEMTSEGAERLVLNLKKGCLSPETLMLKVGARVMFTKNDVQTGRFVNGTLGLVAGFNEAGLPVVKTRDGRTLVVEKEDWSLQDGKRILASISQLPLRLAWAMTVHKSQGMSLDAAHMDLSHAFEYGQGYVALSRVKTLAGLSLAGLNERALQVHPEILERDVAFRENSEAASEAFGNIPPEDLEKMHANFVKVSGGHEPTGETRVVKKLVEGEKSKLDTIREKFPNAYRPWSDEDDADLARRFEDGEKPKDIAKAFGRQMGSIRARLIKLGLIEIDDA